jgi:molecular chaperone Hsp33
VPRLLGAGHLAFTVDQGDHTDRYQGIVELQGSTLAECAHHYFRQSEQIEAGLKVAVARVPGSSGAARWRGGSLMIQRLPPEGDAAKQEAAEDGWRRAVILMSSSTSRELVDPALAPEALLFRLFHEDGVRAYRRHDLAARCRCSRERVERVLRMMPADELETMKIDGHVLVTCQFCSAVYDFDEDAMAALAV